jgi:hypothetical protein
MPNKKIVIVKGREKRFNKWSGHTGKRQSKYFSPFSTILGIQTEL